MGWGGEIATMKIAVTSALQQLSPMNQFSIVAFSDNNLVFSANLVDATPSNVTMGVDWVNALAAVGGTCMLNALEVAVSIAEQSAGNSSVILVGDGVESCASPGVSGIQATVDYIATFNLIPIPIHTFYVSASPVGVPLYQLIADTFGGVFLDTTQPNNLFRRGDVNQDGQVGVSDVVYLLAYGFIPGSPAPDCLDAADVDDNGVAEPLVDAIVLLQALFVPGSPPIPAPSPTCGVDPTADSMTCFGICP